MLSDTTVVRSDPIQTLRQCDPIFQSSTDKLGFTDYWTAVAPKQNELVLVYIGEEFRKLNLDLWTVQPGATLPNIECLPKHAKVVQRLWNILADHGVVYNYNSVKVRSSKPLPTTSSTTLLNELNALFPNFANENQLMSVTASHFADGLTGKTDRISLLFGSQRGQECLNDFYNNLPQLAVMTGHLLNFFNQLLRETSLEGPLRILEVGGDFGGTTKRLAEMLEMLGRPVEYTFTDFSSMLVKETPPTSLQSTYDIVIGTNVVHATSNIVNSTKRMRSLLRKGGFIVLSEVTRIVDWYDLVYGLLDGWWAFNDSRTYPLQHADDWVRGLKEAGFEAASYSRGNTEESNTQQLIIGSTRPNKVLSTSGPSGAGLSKSFRTEKMPYKIVDDTEILADVFFPEHQATTEAMPIGNLFRYGWGSCAATDSSDQALIIHGGGFMTLSRTAIRPHHTRFLLDNGYLPVSIDYRLCPEIDLIAGPMTDVRDALGWVRDKLPAIARARGINMDPTKVVAIGWSTGGHLAMTTAWICKEIGQEPPVAILSFYGPTDFESEDIDRRRAEQYPERTMSFDRIRKSLPTKPITSYDCSNGTDSTNLGWVRLGDPRSELVLSLFKESHGLQVMLNGLSSADLAKPPPLAKIQVISPMAQLKAGRYNVPTFVIHSDRDEIAPFRDSEAFVEELGRRGVKAGLGRVKGKMQIHDLALKPEVDGWVEGVGVGYDFVFEVVRRGVRV